MQQEVDRVCDNRSIKNSDKKGIIAKIKSVKHLDILIAVLVLCLVLALYFGVFSVDKRDIVSTDDTSAAFLKDIERVLSSIEGVGRTKIMINYDSDKSVEIAEKVETTVKVDKDGVSHVVEETREPVIIRGSNGDNPIILDETNGNIKGVIVVCSGGDNVRVKMNVIDALSTVLRISGDKIKVYPMKKY